MDTITHGIVGALVGKAFFGGEDVPANFGPGATSAALSSPTAKAAIVACMIGSTFPDIDVFAGPLARNPLAIMEWHRNITHSLVMLPVWAMLLAAVSLPLARWLRWEAPPFAKLAGIYAAGLLSHIFLDVPTSFGTMTWSPLNYSRVSWDWIFIIDFTFSTIALAPQLAAWCYREPAKFALARGRCVGSSVRRCIGSLQIRGSRGIWIPGVGRGNCQRDLGGPVFCSANSRVRAFAGRERVGRAWRWPCSVRTCFPQAWPTGERSPTPREWAASHHLQVESLAALPLPPTLTHWAGIVTTPEGVWRTTFPLPGGKLESAELYAAANSDRYIAEAKTLRDVQVYLWFARFPIWQVEHVHGATVAEVTDVRFFRQNLQTWNKESARPSPGTRIAGQRSGIHISDYF